MAAAQLHGPGDLGDGHACSQQQDDPAPPDHPRPHGRRALPRFQFVALLIAEVYPNTRLASACHDVFLLCRKPYVEHYIWYIGKKVHILERLNVPLIVGSCT